MKVQQLQQLSLLDEGKRMLVSASPLVIEGLRSLGCDIIASTGFPVQLPPLAARLLPDMVLLHADGRSRDDVLVPLRRLRSQSPTIRVVVMLPTPLVPRWMEWLETIPCEVMAHDCDAATLRAEFGRTDAGIIPEIPLSAREVQVLGLVAMGLTNRAIASRLSLSEFTVKNYLKHVHEKFGVHSRTQAVTAAALAGYPVMPRPSATA